MSNIDTQRRSKGTQMRDLAYGLRDYNPRLLDVSCALARRYERPRRRRTGLGEKDEGKKEPRPRATAEKRSQIIGDGPANGAWIMGTVAQV